MLKVQVLTPELLTSGQGLGVLYKLSEATAMAFWMQSQFSQKDLRKHDECPSHMLRRFQSNHLSPKVQFEK